MAEWGLKHAEGISLRYDEIAAFETLFRATFCGKLTLFRATFVRISTLFRATFLFGISWGEEMFCFCGEIFEGFYNFVGGIFFA